MTDPQKADETPAERSARIKAETKAEADRHPPVDLTLPIAAVVVISILASATPLLSLVPGDGDGAGWVLSALVMPALAVAVAGVMWDQTVTRPRNLTGNPLWWLLLVLPVGTFLAAIPGILLHPEYYDPPITVILTSALMVVIGMLIGPLIWFFLLMPGVRLIVGLIRWMMGRAPLWQAFIPGILLLPLGALIILGPLAASGFGAGRAGGLSFLLALLGIPGSYDVVSPGLLWILRGLVIATIIVWVLMTRSGRRPKESSAPDTENTPA